MCAVGVSCQPWCVILEAQMGMLTCLPAAYVQQAAAAVNQHLPHLPSLKQASVGTIPAGQIPLLRCTAGPEAVKLTASQS